MGLGFRAGQGFAIAKVDGGARWGAPCYLDMASVRCGSAPSVCWGPSAAAAKRLHACGV